MGFWGFGYVRLARRDVVAGEFARNFGRIVGQLGHERVGCFLKGGDAPATVHLGGVGVLAEDGFPIRRSHPATQPVNKSSWAFAFISRRFTVDFMTRQQRADYVARELAKLYPTTPIPLDHTDAFTLLVAVVLSAQCTDKKVNEVTPALFAVAGTPAKMAALSVDKVLGLIRQLGLAPQKSKALVGLAQLIMTKHGGQVPRTFEELEELPGVGHKTASVVMAQAFGVPAFPVDTHIHRLAKRWKLSPGKSVEQVERDLKKVFPEDSWNSLHLRIIFYGREHCTARGCDGRSCGICAKLREG